MFIELSGRTARAALACSLICCGGLFGCASTMLKQVDQSDRDTTGTYDGLWNATVVSTVTNQPQPGGWVTRCGDRSGEDLGNFVVSNGEASLGAELPSTYVNESGNFRFAIPLEEVATASTRSDASITNGNMTYILHGSLKSKKGKTTLGIAQFGNSGCTSKIKFKKLG